MHEVGVVLYLFVIASLSIKHLNEPRCLSAALYYFQLLILSLILLT